MSWAYFQNQAAWDTYHNAACTANGIPRPGYNAADNTTVMMNDQWTTAWIGPIQVKGTGNVTAWVAHVSDADVLTYGLNAVPDSAVVMQVDANGFPTGTYIATIGGKQYVSEPNTLTYHKAKPATWTDPHDGTVYTVTVP